VYTFSRNCSASVPISTFMCEWFICSPCRISPHSRIVGSIVGIINRSQSWMWKLGLLPSNLFSGNICFKFSVLVLCSVLHPWESVVGFSCEYWILKRGLLHVFEKTTHECYFVRSLWPPKQWKFNKMPVCLKILNISICICFAAILIVLIKVKSGVP
jgi:hypothetical protein